MTRTQEMRATVSESVPSSPASDLATTASKQSQAGLLATLSLSDLVLAIMLALAQRILPRGEACF